jgi:hypothetical protein
MRIRMSHFLAAVVVLSGVGCGSSTAVRKSIDPNLLPKEQRAVFEVKEISSEVTEAPQQFIVALNDYIESEMMKKGLLSNLGRGSYVVTVAVKKYQMRSDFNRFMFGAFAGQDGVSSVVTVYDKYTGEIVGESEVSSYNSTAVGSPDMIAEMHAKEIVSFLSGDD